LKYYLLFLLLISKFCFADCEQVSDRCAAVGEWEFSLSVGAGVTTNPVNGGDNIPLILIPEISYYGENVFFENNTLGYTFFDSDNVIVSVITKLNHENAYFSRWHPQNIFIESTTASSGSPIDVGTPDEGLPGQGLTDDELNDENQRLEVNIDDIASKDWAIDAGVQINWFINQTIDIQVQLLHDINKVYNGFNSQVQLTKMVNFKQLPDTALSYSLGANINSENLVDYFYGIPPESDLSQEQVYQGKLSVNPYFRLDLTHQISARWNAKFTLKRLFLDNGTSDSPLVKDNHINTIFAGVTYDF